MAKSKKGIKAHTVLILGTTWKIELYLEDSKFLVEVAESDPLVEAITDADRHTMYFKQSAFHLSNIIHETIHAYVAACCVDHSDLDKNSFEEIMASLFGQYGELIIKQSKEILRSLK